MEITFIENKDQWNSYINAHATPDGGFLQSWQWGEFQKSYGRPVFRMGVIENGEIIYGWQIIKMALPLGMSYFYAPRPISANYGLRIADYKLSKVVKDMLEKIKELAKKEKAVFIRVDATSIISPLVRGDEGGLKNYGFKKTNLSIQPQEELIVDVSKEIDQLLSEMKPKTRYNIKIAQKHEVKIDCYQKEISAEIFEFFWSLITKTSERQSIRPHPQEYYRKMLGILMNDGAGRLYLARFDQKIIAAILVLYFSHTATYLHGGSDDNFKNLMAPHLLQWQAISDARANGLKFYNFGGVSAVKKSWEGITRFKNGFSPNTEYTKYAGVWDYPVNNFFYFFYKTIKKIKP